MKGVPISSLQHPDSPEVIKALEIRCSICHVPPKEFCHAIGVGKRMASLVHVARATEFMERKGKGAA